MMYDGKVCIHILFHKWVLKVFYNLWDSFDNIQGCIPQEVILFNFARPFALVFLALSLSHTQWVQTNGPEDGAVLSLTVSGSNLLAGTGGSVFRSIDKGDSWTQSNGGLTNINVSCFVVSGSSLFAGTSEGVYHSTDNGISWTETGSGLPSFSDVRSLAVRGLTLFAGTYGNGVFRSTDNGDSWTETASGLTNSYVRSLAVRDSTLFAGTYGGMFRSSNNATSWTESGLTHLHVLSLVVSGSTFFAGTSYDGIFRSMDNGTSWTEVNRGLTHTRVHSLAISGSTLIAGTDGGVYHSTDNGNTWTEFNSGLTSFFVSSLVVSDSMLFAGTDGGGVWRRPLSEATSGISPGKLTPQFGFRMQNVLHYGQPVRFSLVAKEEVRLDVFDPQGQKMATLLHVMLPSGEHEVPLRFQAPQGLYFLRLQAGRLSLSQMVILRK